MGRRRAAALVAKNVVVSSRPRGGASYACPRCGGRTEVVDTRRHEDGVRVRRVRQCVDQPKRRCERRFTTTEEVES